MISSSNFCGPPPQGSLLWPLSRHTNVHRVGVFRRFPPIFCSVHIVVYMDNEDIGLLLSIAPIPCSYPPIQPDCQRRTHLETCPLKHTLHSKLPSLQFFRPAKAPTRRIVASREFLGNPPSLNRPAMSQ